MMNKIKEMENEIREMEKANILNRDLKKIETLQKEIKEMEDEMMKDLEW